MSPTLRRAQKRACDVCYEKKIHCSIPDPEGPCEWCENRGLQCTFERERPRKRKLDSVNPSDIQSILERVDRLEKALLQTQATPIQSTPLSLAQADTENARASVQSETNSSHVTFPGLEGDQRSESTVLASQLGPNWFFSGISISSEAGYQWLSTRTGQNVTGAEFRIPVRSPLHISMGEEAGSLPDKSSVQTILKAFHYSSFRLSFPILDDVLFETTLETAYDPINTGTHPLSISQISANACVLGVLSLSPHFCSETDKAMNADMFASKANALLAQVAGDTSLTLLQTALILELRCVLDGYWLGAVPFHSIACRIVCSLAGKTPAAGNPHSDREARHTQALFWLCYILDKDLSLRAGSPPLLNHTYCDTLPQDSSLDDYSYSVVMNLRPGIKAEIRTYISDGVHLAILKEKVCQLLFSARALRDSDNTLLSSIRQLDDEIESWRLSIPANLRPALCVSQKALMESFNESMAHVKRRLYLQLDYHHLMTVIHTTVRRCTTEVGDGNEDLHHVVHSSFDLSLVASRSTLWCLKFLILNMPKEVFRLITLYSTTAAMSLFLDIVIHPHSQQAQLDLELLISTANSIRGMDMSSLTASEIDRVREASNFVMRLVWLGTCGIMKQGEMNTEELIRKQLYDRDPSEDP